MNNATLELTRLCEAWSERMTSAARDEQHRYAEELLRLLGWEQPIPFTPGAAAEAIGARTYLLRADCQTTIAALFTPPGVLDPPGAMLDRRLDYCAAGRKLTAELDPDHVHYVLVSDLFRTYLYDLRTDSLLLHAATPQEFNRELTPVLGRAAVERGAFEEIRRQPRSAAARQLREWRQAWVERIGDRAGLSEESAALVLDRLVVIRYLFEHDILRRTRWRLQQRFERMVEQAESGRAAGCGAALATLFHDMYVDWRIDLFASRPEIDQALQDDEPFVQLIRETPLLSRGKFSIAAVLESFNYGDPPEKMRVRMVPDMNEERDAYLARQTVDTIDDARIEIDLNQEGYRAIFHWFDKVVALYDRLESDFNARAFRDAPGHSELDLFEWSERDSGRPSACGDKFAHACESGFGLFYTGQHQYRVARLLLTLHLISRYHETRTAVDAFPGLDRALIKRPKVLPADRVMNARHACNAEHAHGEPSDAY